MKPSQDIFLTSAEARQLDADGSGWVDDAVTGLGVENVLPALPAVEAVNPVEVEGSGGGGVGNFLGQGGGLSEGHGVLPRFLGDEVLGESLRGGVGVSTLEVRCVDLLSLSLSLSPSPQ